MKKTITSAEQARRATQSAQDKSKAQKACKTDRLAKRIVRKATKHIIKQANKGYHHAKVCDKLIAEDYIVRTKVTQALVQQGFSVEQSKTVRSVLWAQWF